MSQFIQIPMTIVTASDHYDEKLRGCCWPEKKPWKFSGLTLMCFLGFGSYFCYDIPGALQNNIINDLGINTSQFLFLYSIYSWPNVIMSFIGGFLLDRIFGIRLGTLIYTGIALAGSVIFAAGAFWNIFWVLMLGRFIFGIGSESLQIAQNNYAIFWFKGKQLNMMFAFFSSFIQIGSSVSFLTMEPIYNFVSKKYSGPECIGVVLFLSSLTCVLSMICACLLGMMDRRTEVLLKRGYGEEPQIPRLSDVKDFSLAYWLAVVICLSYQVAVSSFISVGKVFFMKKYLIDAAPANILNSSLYFVSTVASPLCGFIVDKTGKNIFWISVSLIGAIGAQGMLTFTYVNPYVGMVAMGICFSMLTGGLWLLIALIVPEYQLGTAIGMAQSVQNFGFAIVEILAGIIINNTGYYYLGLFFLGWLCVALFTSILLLVFDKIKLEGYLNMTQEQRKKYDAKNKIINSETLSNNQSESRFSVDDIYKSHPDVRMKNGYSCNVS